MRNILVLLASTLSLLACRPAGDSADSSEALSEAGATGAAPSRGLGDPVKKGAEQVTPETLPDDVATVDPKPTNDAAGPPAAPPANEQDAAPAATIPQQYRGRWGMVPADCTSTRGDAKGLISVGERSIKFYEATATLTERRPAVATSFSGLFAFTGEGQTWQRVQTLTRSGDALTRAEEENNFSYTRCAS